MPCTLSSSGSFIFLGSSQLWAASKIIRQSSGSHQAVIGQSSGSHQACTLSSLGSSTFQALHSCGQPQKQFLFCRLAIWNKIRQSTGSHHEVIRQSFAYVRVSMPCTLSSSGSLPFLGSSQLQGASKMAVIKQFQEVIRQSSGSHQAVIRQSSGNRQVVVRQSSGS